MIYSYKIDDRIIDDYLPDKDDEVNDFTSMELPQKSSARSNAHKKTEARPIIGLIMDILGTVYTSTQNDMKRSKAKESRFT